MPGIRGAEGKEKGKGVIARVGSGGSPIQNARSDEQEPDMRCGTLGTSGHVTAKSSIRRGVCFMNPAFTRRTICVLPWEISRLSARTGRRVTGADRPGEVSRGHSRPEAGKAIALPVRYFAALGLPSLVAG